MSIDLISGHTFHGRKGAVKNGFRYSVDYVLFDAETDPRGPSLFSRTGGRLASVLDRDHGGAPKAGRGPVWAREVFQQHGICFKGPLLLLTQMRLLGYVFNPVSFWLAYDGDALKAVIAEVSNTFGDRHSYICAKSDGSAIAPTDRIEARKLFHVSPFQPIEGGYSFRFDITEERVGIWIDLNHGEGGVIATLTGPRVPLTNMGILRSLLRRPLGARRVMALIHWQALKLFVKGARYRSRPVPPREDVSGQEENRGVRA
jgi:DUF1365 family protein